MIIVDTPIPTSEATFMKYAPTKREYNRRVITDWRATSFQDVLRGDHVKSDECGIPHSLVEKKVGRKLHLIGCVKEDKKW